MDPDPYRSVDRARKMQSMEKMYEIEMKGLKLINRIVV